MYYFIFIIIVV